MCHPARVLHLRSASPRDVAEILPRTLALNSHEQVRINLSASLTTDDDPAKLRQVKCPTLLLAGDGDFLSSPTSLEATARVMPDARVEVIDFAGHVPYFEATAAFESRVQNFINETEVNRARSYNDRALCG